LIHYDFIVNEYDPAYNALLNLPSLQMKLRIPCTYSYIPLELLILPCNIMHKRSDNAF